MTITATKRRGPAARATGPLFITALIGLCFCGLSCVLDIRRFLAETAYLFDGFRDLPGDPAGPRLNDFPKEHRPIFSGLLHPFASLMLLLLALGRTSCRGHSYRRLRWAIVTHAFSG